MRQVMLLPLSLMTIYLIALPAGAQQADEMRSRQEQSSAKQTQHGTPNPQKREAVRTVLSADDGEWISLTGTVKAAAGSTFTLGYNGGQIIVEMDDYDWYNDGVLRPGDRVTVTGAMNNDFFEAKTLEASSVYIPKLNKFYFASAADEEGGYYSFPVGQYAQDDEWVGLTGTVIGEGDGTLMIDVGAREVEVDTSGLAYDPDVDQGDRVSVFGEMDDADLFEDRELLASSVIALSGS